MKILIVDDEAPLARMAADHLRESGHDTDAATSGAAALARLGEGWDAVITDLKMAPPDGLELLRRIRADSPGTDVILMTAYASVDAAVQALRGGAWDFITKPLVLDELALAVTRLAERRELARENTALRRELAERDRFAEMVGDSPAIAAVRDLADRVAPTDSTVLILGESGTGKELVARRIHRQSRRAGGPFVAVHAAALPESLLESELFGHEKGAFTGATAARPGRLETAAGGTLFLDEIGELPPGFQVKLLRFLQERTFVRLGSNRPVRVDARIAAATNRDLGGEIRAGRFREDLYYRLAVFPITVPPLRERLDDIPGLCRHILTRLGAPSEPDPEVLRLLAGHDWPGNVRELENVLERALILAGGRAPRPEHVQLPEPVFARPGPGTNPATLHDAERRLVEAALRKAGNNKSKAARLLGITRRVLHTKLRNLGIGVEDVEG